MVWWKRKQQFSSEDALDNNHNTELEIRERRRNRFRILVCIDGTEESYEGLRFAGEIGKGDECDIILLYVREIDQGLRSGGLEMRVARANMLDWDLDLPGIKYLKRGRDMLISEGELSENWKAIPSHRDIRGDPLGDNKIEYRKDNGKSIVLKLKTAPDTVSGIIEQYELGPYNLVIIGRPSRWSGELRSIIRMSVVQKVAMLSPCSILIAREGIGKEGFLIYCDGTEQSHDAMRRTAVLAQNCDRPVSLMGVAEVNEERSKIEAALQSARAILEKIDIKVHSTLCEVGDPAQCILDVGKDYELISVSEASHSRFRLWLTHSVAFAVMGKAATSVLNVK